MPQARGARGKRQLYGPAPRRQPARVGQRRPLRHHLARRGRQAPRHAGGARGRGHLLGELDRDRLASGSWDNNIVIWSITHGTQLATLEEAYPTCLATLDGNRLASGSDRPTIVIWCLRNDKELAKLEGHDKNVTCLAPLDDGRLASGSWDAHHHHLEPR